MVSQWNEEITEGLAQGALATFSDCGVAADHVTRWNVPGSFELVYGCQRMMAKHPEIDAVIAIGNVIQGETKHFDYVCSGATQGIMTDQENQMLLEMLPTFDDWALCKVRLRFRLICCLLTP